MPETRSKFRHRLSRLRSYLLIAPAIFLITGVLGTVSLLADVFDRSGRIQHSLARFWARIVLKLCLTSVRVAGLEKIDLTKPYLYIFNHLSALDIPVIYVHLPVQFRILAKKELFRYPFLGWHLHLSGQIPIDEKSAAASMRSMNRAVEALRAGVPLVIFPEGGRSLDGKVQPFMRGAFYAALKAQVEIVPVALVGTFEMLPMNSFHVQPRPLEMHVGAPIPITGHAVRAMEKLATEAKAAMEDLYYPHAQVSDPRQAQPIAEDSKLEA